MEKMKTTEAFKLWSTTFIGGFRAAKKELGESLPTVKSYTLDRWFTDQSFKGQHLFKVQDFLIQQGYCLEEIDGLRPQVQKLHHLFAVGEITAEQLINEADFTVDSILRTFRGIVTPNKVRMRKIEQLIAKCENPVHQLPSFISKPTSTSPHVGALSMRQAIEITGRALQDLAALLPIIEDRSTPGERDEFRKLVGTQTIFALNNRLTRLCSETARRELARNQP